MTAPAGFTTVSASNIQDGANRKLASGRVTFFPVNDRGESISAIAGGDGGPILQTGVTMLVVNGAITTLVGGGDPIIANSAMTTPRVTWRMVITATGAESVELQGPGYSRIQTTSDPLNLDTLPPNQPLQATIQTGPQGLSNYQLAVQNGYSGTESEWLATLVGPPGASGIVGIPIYSTAAAGAEAGSGAASGGYYFVPSASVDGSYDIYKNNAGTAVLVSTLPDGNLVSEGTGVYWEDAEGFRIAIVKRNGDAVTMPLYEGRVSALEAIAAGAQVVSSTPILRCEDGDGFGLTVVDATGKMPIVEPRLEALESTSATHTGQITTILADLAGGGGGGGTVVASQPGPIAGTLHYSNDFLDASINQINGCVPFIPPAAVADLQIGMMDCSGTPETPGPQYSAVCSIEYPLGKFHPVMFNGRRQVVVDGGGVPLSDPRAVDIPAGAIAYLHFQFTRSAGETAAFPDNFFYGVVTGNSVYSPATPPSTPRGNGVNWDAVELLKQRTLTDLVATSGSTTATSASGAFVPAELNQTLVCAGIGLPGNTTRYSYVSATQITLANAPTSSSAGATATLSATDKTTGAYDYHYGDAVLGFAPFVIVGRSATALRSFLVLGDSITFGLNGDYVNKGSWAVQGLNYAAAATLATAALVANPYMQASMPGETIANLIATHDTRLTFASRCKYTIGMLGTNDLALSATLSQMQGNILTLWRQLALRGTKPCYGTIIPSTTSSNGWADQAGQTIATTNSVRIAFNAWYMDGAPIDHTTGAAVAVGTSSATANRCQVISSTGALVSAASGPGTHPCCMIFDLASAVDTAGTGKWRTDLGTPTADGTHPNQVIHYVMAGVVNGALAFLL